MWKEMWSKQCPKCKSAIEKNGGWPHMTCQKCSYEFCWNWMGDYHNHNSATCTKIATGKFNTFLIGFALLMLLAVKVIFTAGLDSISLAHSGIILYSVCSFWVAAFYVFMVPFGIAGIIWLICKCDHLWILLVVLEIIGLVLLFWVDFLCSLFVYGLYIGLPMAMTVCITFFCGAIQSTT